MTIQLAQMLVPPPFPRKYLTRVVVTILLTASMQACTSWRTNPVTPESFPRRDSLFVVRVTLNDGTRFHVQHPHMTQDSLRGVDTRADQPLTVPLSDVQHIQTRHFDVGKTVGLVLGLGATAGVALLYALAKSFEGF